MANRTLAFSVFTYHHSDWGGSDSKINVSGFVVEDFEDVSLAPGLRIQLAGVGAASYGPTNRLSRVWDPITDDPNTGQWVYSEGRWDGSKVLLNYPGDIPGGYSGTSGTVVLLFPGGVSAVGFSIQHVNQTCNLRINGNATVLANLNSSLSVGRDSAGGRSGYVRVDAAMAEIITSVAIEPSGGDAWALDHVAFLPASFTRVEVAGFPATPWPRTDQALGLNGFAVEDFEDINLVTGLSVGFADTSTPQGPQTSLPLVWQAGALDPAGFFFPMGAWDGSRALVNRTRAYSGTGNDFEWADLTFSFAGGASSVGFSLQAANQPIGLEVNGTSVRVANDLITAALSNQRNGFLRLDAAAGQTIKTLRITSAADAVTADGFSVDHLSFLPIGNRSGVHWIEWPTSTGGNGHFYGLTESPGDWRSLEAVAQSYGGHLASVLSAAEQAFLELAFLNGAFATRPLWLGLSDEAAEGVFRWSTGEPFIVASYRNWHSGQPDNDAGLEDYVCMNWHRSWKGQSQPAGTWNDAPLAGSSLYPGAHGPYYGIMEIPGPPSQPGLRFELGNEFSASSNPIGPWSYGWTTASSALFTRFGQAQTVSNLDAWVLSAGVTPSDPSPWLAHNNTAEARLLASGILLPNDVVASPGQAGERLAVRWSAPGSGGYRISAIFESADILGATSDIRVLSNSVQLAASTLPGSTGRWTYNGFHQLRTGDTIDFAVGPGLIGSSNDVTRLAVTIEQQSTNLAPAPPAWAPPSLLVGVPVDLVIPPFTDSDSYQTVTYQATAIPGGLQFDPITRRLTGVPPAAGSFPLTIVALDDGGPPLSATASFTLHVVDGNTPPVVSIVPYNPAVPCGAALTLVANVNGTPPLSYRWFFQGKELIGERNSTLPLSASPATAGLYEVIVGNPFGSSRTDTKLVVEDLEAPVFITCPSNIILRTSNPQGMAVNYHAVAVDNCSQPTVVFSPPSGSIFAPGIHSVTCRAADESGNQTNCFFTVEVSTPQRAVTGIPRALGHLFLPNLSFPWGASDMVLNVSGFAIEDFEDTNLVSGLEIELSDVGYPWRRSSWLPRTWDPFSNLDDPNPAKTFRDGIWDGSHVLLNRRAPIRFAPAPKDYRDHDWSDVTFRFPLGASGIGFSLEGMDQPLRLLIDGNDAGLINDVLPFSVSGGLVNGYLRIESASGEAIQSITLVNSDNGETSDSLAIDHLAFRPASVPRYVLSGFDSQDWPISDQDLGLENATIEDFEDVGLIPDLQEGIAYWDGSFSFPMASFLPFILDAPVDHLGGANKVLKDSAWDGTHVLVNCTAQERGPSHPANILLAFDTGVSSVGFSLHDMEVPIGVIVNGIGMGYLSSYLPLRAGRNGYVRIDAPPGETISTLTLVSGYFNNRWDEFAIDHLAIKYASAPETLTVPVRANATYLRLNGELNGEISVPAIPIPLSPVAEPGDLILLSISGFYHSPQFTTNMIGVFSASTHLAEASTLRRVSDAVDAGADVVTSPTFIGNLPTDIPEDFEITSEGIPLVVPPNANYLFVSAKDNRFGNNDTGQIWYNMTDYAVVVHRLLRSTPAPQALVFPATATVECGSDLALTAFAVGNPPLTYEWQHGGASIPGAVGPTLFRNRVTPADEGSYEVIVRNALGTNRASASVSIRDTTPPVIHCQDIYVSTEDPAGLPVFFAVPATDSCSAVEVVCTPASGSNFLPGKHTVSCTATDLAGNSKQCDFQIVVLLCEP